MFVFIKLPVRNTYVIDQQTLNHVSVYLRKLFNNSYIRQDILII